MHYVKDDEDYEFGWVHLILQEMVYKDSASTDRLLADIDNGILNVDKVDGEGPIFKYELHPSSEYAKHSELPPHILSAIQHDKIYVCLARKRYLSSISAERDITFDSWCFTMSKEAVTIA